MSILQAAWFALIGVLLAGYVILDGYDLGIGFWHLVSRSAEERKALRRAVAPYWDANEVWLITAGGALFAAFPMVYATVFSGFYLAMMLVVFALIFRAVSIEMVEHVASPAACRFWEIAFGLGSVVTALLLGVAMGNILRGLPLDSQGNYTGSFFDLLNPFSLLVGVTGLALFAMHGALFAGMKRQAEASISVLAILIVLCILAAQFIAPPLMARLADAPYLWALPLLFGLVLVGTGFCTFGGKTGTGFIWSSVFIALLFASLGAALFPNFVPALGNGRPLTIANSSSSPLTLAIMLGVAGVGMALVLSYTIWVRRALRR